MPKATDPVSDTPLVEAVPEAVALSQAESERQSMIDKMRDYLAAQPKRRVKVRNDGDVFVSINGYSVLVKPNVWLHVPEPIAQLLEEGDYI